MVGLFKGVPFEVALIRKCPSAVDKRINNLLITPAFGTYLLFQTVHPFEQVVFSDHRHMDF